MRAFVMIAVSVAALTSGRVSAGEQAPLSIQERVRKSNSILVAQVERVLPPGTLIPTNKHSHDQTQVAAILREHGARGGRQRQ